MMSVYVLLEVGEGKTDDIVVIALNVVYIFTKGSLDCVSAGLIIRFIRFDVRLEFFIGIGFEENLGILIKTAGVSYAVSKLILSCVFKLHLSIIGDAANAASGHHMM